MTQFKNYINGEWVDPTSGKFFKNYNPADKTDIIGEYPDSTQKDVDAAVKAASEAFGTWKKMPAPKRGDILRKAGDIFTARKKELARVMTREMGKPTFETEGDVQEAIDTCYYAASETRRLFGMTVPSEMDNKMNMTIRVPVGVCGIITAWNFPIAVPSWKIIPALAAGNTVIFKPSEDAPDSGRVFIEIMEEAGLPKGALNLVQGDGKAGAALVEHDDVHLIGFTGSTEVGKKIAGRCGELNKRCSLEMGGKNAQIVLDDANMELAIDGAVWGAFGTTGQRCTATSRVIAEKGVYDEFCKKIVERANKLILGPGLVEGNDVGPVINSAALENIKKYVAIGKEEGAELFCGGEVAEGENLKNGNFFKPTVFAGVTKDMRIFREEIFGPVLSITKADNYDHAIELQNYSHYGLSSSIYTRDVNKAFQAMHEIESGITYVNAPTIGAEAHMPFGGVKGTGNGHREGGWTAFEIFTEWKTIYIDYSDSLQRAQIDNYDDKAL